MKRECGAGHWSPVIVRASPDPSGLIAAFEGDGFPGSDFALLCGRGCSTALE